MTPELTTVSFQWHLIMQFPITVSACQVLASESVIFFPISEFFFFFFFFVKNNVHIGT